MNWTPCVATLPEYGLTVLIYHRHFRVRIARRVYDETLECDLWVAPDDSYGEPMLYSTEAVTHWAEPSVPGA
jgi:hypothetical protein